MIPTSWLDNLLTGRKELNGDTPLVNWIWSSYFRTSLIPLLVVEVALILLYFFSNSFSNHYNIEAIREIAEQTLTETVNLEASSINEQLKSITSATNYLAGHTQKIMSGEIPVMPDSPSYYGYTEDGVFYSIKNHGRGALFYSGAHPINAKERQKAYISAGLDNAYRGILEAYPLVVQVYYNTYDSMNRIFPFFNVLEQYEAKMEIPQYNFYYEADSKHNPEREVVWTDVYLDPAGQGWMTSATAPVYSGDFLEGVVGADITVTSIIEQVLNLDIPWEGYGLLLGKHGTIIAMPEQAESDWSLNELRTYEYTEAVRQDTFKPEAFNLYKRLESNELARKLEKNSSGLIKVRLSDDRILVWATVPETGWKLLVNVPERRVYQTANSLALKLNHIAWLVVVAMVIFYLVFFTLLYFRAKKMSEFISKPLEKIEYMTQQISKGTYQLNLPEFNVAELTRTAQAIQEMGRHLESQFQLREDAEKAREDLTGRLQTVLDVSPDGYVTIDSSDRVVLVNPAFCTMTGTSPEYWTGILRTELWEKIKLLSASSSQIRANDISFSFSLERPEWRVIKCEQFTDLALTSHSDTNTVIFFNDITVSSELENMKNNFLASVAHALRTPLTTVLGYAEILSHKTVDLVDQKTFLEAIINESYNLVKLINDILLITKIDSAPESLVSLGSFDLDSLIRSSISQQFSGEHKNQISLELSANKATVKLNPEVFAIALTHLVENAIKFSNSGSKVVIQSKYDESGTKAIVKVIDHGVGMSVGQLKFAFERFWRVDNAGTILGTGLGLAIVKELSEKMNIELTVQSELGQGTCVSMLFPVV